MKLSVCQIFGVRVHPLTLIGLHRSIADFIHSAQHALVLNVNVHGLNLAFRDKGLRNFLNSANIVFCDGAGVVLGAKILECHIPYRITYADWTWQLAEFAEPHGFTFFFLGAKPGIADKAAARLKERFSDLRIVGTHHGYFDKTPGSPENETVIAQISAVKPNILIVGFGMPMQEYWLMENWDRIDANVALSGGAVFDYVSGDLQRGPKWMTDHGFEWLARLFIEPRRLWKRYIIGNPLFIWRVIKQRLGLLHFDET
ncbi:MAG TPA: glycosyltransferase [Chloroflexi bacterium]|nr:glycosyltransferase [Chloroflexota bacterium]